MVTPAAERIFIDTNILVFAFIPAAEAHQKARDELAVLAAEGRDLWVSHQVIREFIATVTRPQAFTKPIPISEVIVKVNGLMEEMKIATEADSQTSKLLELVNNLQVVGKQVHDANIVATMLIHNIPEISTDNTGDFQRYSPLIKIRPLR